MHINQQMCNLLEINIFLCTAIAQKMYNSKLEMKNKHMLG